MIFSNITSEGLVIADFETGQLIANLRPRNIGEDWKLSTRDDLTSGERMRLIAIGTERESLNLVMRPETAANELRFFQINLKYDAFADQALGILSPYYYHYLEVANRDNYTQILIAERVPCGILIQLFSIAFRYNLIYEGLRIVDSKHKRVIAEVPSLIHHSILNRME